jgi:chromosome segregation ATPase
MTRRSRDLENERRALRAAADRLFAGEPLHSSSGKLTGTELITESRLRRDVVYGDHKDLVEAFQGRVKAQHETPASVERAAEHNRTLQDANTKLKSELATEREKIKTLTKIAAELSLELEQANEELASLRQLPRLTPRQTEDEPDSSPAQ